jgi:hypothetical protein
LTKVIAVQDGLQHLSYRLTGKGYRVVDIDNTLEAIDAILYSPSMVNGSYKPNVNQLFTSGNNKFVLMINADEQSEDEILSMIDSIR